MHAIIASIGTDGDILPFLGLGVALRARGHRVTVVAAGNYHDLVVANGVEFRSLVSAEKMRELLANPDFWHPIKTAVFTARWSRDLMEPEFRLLDSIASEPGSVLITNPAVFGAAMAHEKRGVPLCHVILQPWMIHSAIAPALMPIASVPRWAPRFVHSLFYHVMDVVAGVLVGPSLNRLRRSIGLKPMRRILHNWLSHELVIGMFPPWFGPPQKDWPAQIRLAGFPRFDGAVDRKPPVGLPDFLNSHKPTVAFTFGSGMMHASRLFELAARVCESIDCQGVFINRHFVPERLPARMFDARFIPFRDIFPRCAAVVHHGGVGTTAEALAVGTPQLIVPFGFDQLDNGDRVRRLGMGLHTRSKHRLIGRGGRVRDGDVAELANALRQLLSKEFRERCRRFTKPQENALETAASWVEEMAR